MTEYRIVDVSDWQVASEEPLGSKDKDWIRDPASPNELWLWKACREGTGDDWAEKLAEQLAEELGLPHASVELARRRDVRGVICHDLRSTFLTLLPGNELLWLQDPSYPKTRRRKVAEHTIHRVLGQLDALGVIAWPDPEFSVDSAAELFTGYLLFDAWIANQDRHHENWAVLMWPGQADEAASWQAHSRPLVLAPTFDHGSSLGQYENDTRRLLRLQPRDAKESLAAWSAKSKTQLYRQPEDSRPLTTFEAYEAAAHLYPEAARRWLDRLRSVTPAAVDRAVSAIPREFLSSIGREFTSALLATNRERLLSISIP